MTDRVFNLLVTADILVFFLPALAACLGFVWTEEFGRERRVREERETLRRWYKMYLYISYLDKIVNGGRGREG